jgi:hypothetical protein
MEYQVPTKDQSELTLQLPANKVKSSVDGCDLVTTFEWYNPNYVDPNDPTCVGRWEDKRTTEESGILTVSLDDITKMHTEVKISQPFFMKEMKESFGDVLFAGVHDFYDVLVRFKT